MAHLAEPEKYKQAKRKEYRRNLPTYRAYYRRLRAELQALRAKTTPKKRGRPKGKKEQGTDTRINVIAYCQVTGMSNYQIATYWQRVTGQMAAKTTIDSFVADHAIEIEYRQSFLSALPEPERETTSGLSGAQREVVKRMAAARRKKVAFVITQKEMNHENEETRS